MLKTLFTTLQMKVAGTLIAALSIALAVSILFAKAESRRADKWHNEAIERGAMLQVQNDAIRNLETEGKAMQARVEEARKAGDAGQKASRSVSEKLRNASPRNGCPTPRVILEADL